MDNLFIYLTGYLIGMAMLLAGIKKIKDHYDKKDRRRKFENIYKKKSNGKLQKDIN